jgi:hypothetical protein
MKVIKCYWDDLGCPEVPGEYSHGEIVVRVMKGDIEVASGNPDAVVTAIRADFFGSSPYLISAVDPPAWSRRPSVTGSGRNQHPVRSRRETAPPRFSDLGVTKSQSSRSQELASLPKADQEAKIAQESSFAAAPEPAESGGTISTDEDGTPKLPSPEPAQSTRQSHSENDHARSTDRNCEDDQALVEQMTPDKDVRGPEQGHHAVGPNSSETEELPGSAGIDEFHVKIDGSSIR